MIFKIEIERELCITCGNCIDACEELFELGDDDFAQLIMGEINEDNFSVKEYENIECGIEAAESCPAGCIMVFEEGNVIV
jgi:ferredoxin